jgi:virginiamycin A acetyltransferase
MASLPGINTLPIARAAVQYFRVKNAASARLWASERIMTGLAKSALLAARLYLMRRREFDSAKLRAFFRASYNIDVGLYSYGCFDRWRMPGPMRVGRYCSIARTVRSAGGNHPLDAITTSPVLFEKRFGVIDKDIPLNKMLVISDDVWIGHNVVILPGCKSIGRGCVIGAGAIVTKEVEPYSVVVGNPALKIRDRFPPELATVIEQSRWWEKSIADLHLFLKSNHDAFYHPTLSSLQELIEGKDW